MWEYLFDVLQRFQLGNNFIQWIKVLCRSAMAKILVSDSCLQRDTTGLPPVPNSFCKGARTVTKLGLN